MGWDRFGQLKPVGERKWRTRPTEQLAALCPFSPTALNEDVLAAVNFPEAHFDRHIGQYHAAYVGHASEEGFRAQGSSGGMASWVAAELLRRQLVDGVAHVLPNADPANRFGYRISRSMEELRAGAKSRYYPSHLADVLREIRNVPGRYAVIGIPCFIKAVQLQRAHDPLLRERIAFTLGLFCGHMKSARFADSLAWQLGVNPAEVERLDYRRKDASRPANWYTAELTLRDGTRVAKDWWHLADGDWGAGFFQNSACNYCDDVIAETADISFGDAWVEPYSSDGRGTNVVVVRSLALQKVLDAGCASDRIALAPVDSDFILRTQEAGFRQRREGLAYRLSWSGRKMRIHKRVAPGTLAQPWRRKFIYRLRAAIARWSHRMAFVSTTTRRPHLYLYWARSILALYQGLTYSRGRSGKLFDRVERAAAWLVRSRTSRHSGNSAT